MRSILCPLLLAMLPATGFAGMNKNLLVRAYRPCPDGATTCAPQPESSFTFESAVLKTPQPGYTAPNKLALTVEIKGVRDAGGNLVTTDPTDSSDDLRLVIPPGRTTILGNGLTIEPDSGVIPTTEVRIDLKAGKGKASYKAPDTTPESGLFSEAGGLPALYDREGKRLAVTGAQSKP